MYDKGLVISILKNILWSLDQITRRFQSIQSSEDFLRDDIGLEKLDSICMQLINTGEALKEIDKLTEGSLLIRYPDIDWKKAKGMRDIITHHYFDIDAETVFVVCKERIPEMHKIIQKIVNDLEG
ncbi:MAG: HepT-like ribonuclease domain-containing protein [Nitrospirota bacterium]